MVGKLKDGLGAVLEDFYQLAGKLARDEDWTPRWAPPPLDGAHTLQWDLELRGTPPTIAVGAANQAQRWTRNGAGLQPCHPRWDLHVALYEFVGPDLQWGCRRTHRNAPSNGTADAEHVDPPLIRERVFKFSESAIDKIKSKVNSDPPSDGSKPFSTFQSLAVHMWRHVTRARQLKPEDDTVFTVFANCRKRVDPPMPESYFGNLIQAIFTVTSAGLLTMNPPEFGASMIQKAIEMHDAKAIEERNEQFESSPKIFRFKDAGC
ncbi:BAHD ACYLTRANSFERASE DCR-RELATED [Salix viminalis]|uniref:BAHD ACYLTRANSFERASE DCR-RELATED n=1 Tax=Salix viminalis TaxID=40686 RepID=A0A9Q0NLT6_SALVM|nr:BAHD ACYLTRANSFERASE DCR-RELATED [Salix viminalis]